MDRRQVTQVRFIHVLPAGSPYLLSVHSHGLTTPLPSQRQCVLKIDLSDRMSGGLAAGLAGEVAGGLAGGFTGVGTPSDCGKPEHSGVSLGVREQIC